MSLLRILSEKVSGFRTRKSLALWRKNGRTSWRGSPQSGRPSAQTIRVHSCSCRQSEAGQVNGKWVRVLVKWASSAAPSLRGPGDGGSAVFHVWFPRSPWALTLSQQKREERGQREHTCQKGHTSHPLTGENSAATHGCKGFWELCIPAGSCLPESSSHCRRGRRSSLPTTSHLRPGGERVARREPPTHRASCPGRALSSHHAASLSPACRPALGCGAGLPLRAVAVRARPPAASSLPPHPTARPVHAAALGPACRSRATMSGVPWRETSESRLPAGADGGALRRPGNDGCAWISVSFCLSCFPACGDEATGMSTWKQVEVCLPTCTCLLLRSESPAGGERNPAPTLKPTFI